MTVSFLTLPFVQLEVKRDSTHQVRYAFASDTNAMMPQLGVHTRYAVRAKRVTMDGLDLCSEPNVIPRSARWAAATPGAQPALGDLKHAAHRRHWMLSLIHAHECEECFELGAVRSRARTRPRLVTGSPAPISAADSRGADGQLLSLSARQTTIASTVVRSACATHVGSTGSTP